VLLPVLTVFFSQAEDGIRGIHVTGVQTCALPISRVVAAGRSAFILAYPLAGVTPYDSPQQRYDMRTLPDTKRALHERFGVVPGTDRFLVSRNAIEQHLFDLASSSPRLHVESIGHSTEGRDILLAAIGSPETIAMLDELKEQRRAGDDPTLLADPAHDHGRLAGDNVVVLVTAGIHATEVGGVQLMPELIEELATSRDSRILRILDRAIVLIVPTL